MTAISLAAWTPLPNGTGDALAAAGPLSAAASSTRAVVWDGNRVLSSAVPAGGPAGIPRFVGGRLHYGPGWLDNGRWTTLSTPAPTVYGGVRTSAWSADGRRVALLVEGPLLPRGGAPSSLLVERTAAGGERTVAADPGVAAVWVLAAGIVGVGRELRIWDAAGERRIGPAHSGGGVAAISASRDERWLLTIGTDGTALLWDLATLAPPTPWPGAWARGALSPDAEWAVGIDVHGALHAARRIGSELVSAGALPAAGRVRTAVLDDRRILASFEEAPFHRTAAVDVLPLTTGGLTGAGRRSPRCGT